ncbi:MAG: lysophospholipase [Candidatus Obscuribacterales bacterium]|nr:lysophospholipase [Candidatus Obscuribacterales bacterium]
MDSSKKALIQSVLAFCLGAALCIIVMNFLTPKTAKDSSSETNRVIETTKTTQQVTPEKKTAPAKPITKEQTKITSTTKAVSSEKTTQIASVTLPAGPIEQPPAAIRGSMKQVDYEIPSKFSCWMSSGTPIKGVLICIHGFGLYSEAFQALADRVCPKGYVAYSVDARGFGRYIKKDRTADFEGSVTDVAQLIQLVHKTYPGKPIILIGESMGGAIAIQAGSQHQNEIAGIIASAPGDVRYKQVKMDLKVGPKLLLSPNKKRDWGDELMEMATSNPKLIAKWQADPLVRQKLAPKELLGFQKFMGNTSDFAKQIHTTPILFLHGGHDKLTKVKGTIELYNDVPSSKKDLFILGQKDHVMLEEGQFDDTTIRLLETWLANAPR